VNERDMMHAAYDVKFVITIPYLTVSRNAAIVVIVLLLAGRT
jgi:hypothetical protein